MIRIAVVEDEISEKEKLSSFFKKIEEEKNYEFSIDFFSSGENFLFEFSYGKYDLVLMDIHLGDTVINGLEVSRKLREVDEDVTLVFTTNLAQYAIDGYQVKASDYIIKPYAYYDFAMKMDNIFSKLSNDVQKIILKTDGKQVILPVREICYIEVINHTLIYHTVKNDYEVNGAPLSKMAEQLEKYHFSLCNACYLVNLKYVNSVQGFEVMVNNTPLVISRPRKKQFLQDLNAYLGL